MKLQKTISLFCVMLLSATVACGKENKKAEYGCPDLRVHCYRHVENQLVEMKERRVSSFPTYGKKLGCTTKKNARELLLQAARECKRNRAQYFSVGEKSYASLGELLPPISYLPGFRSIAGLKIDFKEGKLYPKAGDIVSVDAYLWHMANVWRLGTTQEKGDDCPQSTLVCAYPKTKGKSDETHNIYTGIPYPGCKRNGWFGKCKVCPSVKEKAKEYCRLKQARSARFIAQVDPKGL